METNWKVVLYGKIPANLCLLCFRCFEWQISSNALTTVTCRPIIIKAHRECHNVYCVTNFLLTCSMLWWCSQRVCVKGLHKLIMTKWLNPPTSSFGSDQDQKPDNNLDWPKAVLVFHTSKRPFSSTSKPCHQITVVLLSGYNTSNIRQPTYSELLTKLIAQVSEDVNGSRNHCSVDFQNWSTSKRHFYN